VIVNAILVENLAAASVAPHEVHVVAIGWRPLRAKLPQRLAFQ
jgi:hypothetical protein